MTKPPDLRTIDSLYNTLNPAQKRAVDAIEGPVMVIAGPGTGKTTVLTLRIANILRKTDTAPDAILTLTFTESGAYNMRRKLAEIIGPSAYKVNIHTFHGFASKIIEQYPDYFPRIIGSTVITQAEKIKIVGKIISSKKIKLLRPYGDPDYYIKSVLKEIQILKRENVSVKDFYSSLTQKKYQELNEKQTEKNAELAFVYDQYEQELAEQRYYDFEDMLLELIRAMEGDVDFKLILQEQFQYILADEHQDANASQNRILELLADFHDSPNLFIVGDDKQAIYRFQGASLDNFLYFSKKYKNALVIDLEHNYRSHQGILDASHSLILNNPTIEGRERKRLVALQIGTAPIDVLESPTVQDEIDLVADLVADLISKGNKAEDIAILYRDNKHALPISSVFKSRSIVHRIESDNDIMNDPDIVKIIILCRAINNLSDGEALASVLFLSELKCNPAEIADLCKEARRKEVSLHQAIKNSKSDSIKNIKHQYKRLVEWSGEAQTLQFTDFLQKLIQDTDMMASIVSASNSLERLNSIQAFCDHVATAAKSKRTFYLKDFIEYIDIVKEHGIAAKRNYSDHIGGVRLMTAHRAKGLEFNHVFIIHSVDGVWGNRSSRNHFNIPVIEHARNVGRIEDERRLFYVAMTRARNTVTITYALSNGDKETIKSQFISEIDPTLIVFEETESEDKEAYIMSKFTKPKEDSSISILNANFVRSKFMGQPLSVTHLNNYLQCPWRYFFVNLIRIPQAESKHQMYGTAVHSALRTFFNSYKDGRDLGEKKLFDLFKRNIDMQPMSSGDRDEAIDKGKKALKGYYDEYKGSWNKRLVTEYGVKGVEGEVQITGKLDKVEFLDNKNVIVVDYKTGKPKSRNEIEGKTKTSDGNYKRQLVFYKLLLDSDKKFNMSCGEIDFIEPNERGKYKKERFDVDPKEVEELKIVIAKMVEEVTGLKFIQEKCEDKECQYCKLGKLLR